MGKAIRTPSVFLVIGYVAFAMSCGLELNEIDCVVSQLSLAIYGERANLCILVFLWVMRATP